MSSTVNSPQNQTISLRETSELQIDKKDTSKINNKTELQASPFKEMAKDELCEQLIEKKLYGEDIDKLDKQTLVDQFKNTENQIGNQAEQTKQITLYLNFLQ